MTTRAVKVDAATGFRGPSCDFECADRGPVPDLAKSEAHAGNVRG